jgi:sensor histidine kinase YesM
MRTPLSHLLGFAAAVSTLFYLPRLLEALTIGLSGRGDLLGAGLIFGGSLALGRLNDELRYRLRDRPAWLDVAVTVLTNVAVVLVLSALAFRVHQWMFGGDFTGLLRRAYRIRMTLAALLAAFYVRLLIYRRISRAARVENLELRERQTAARLGALQQKLDPHFLFNTLNTISGAIRQDQREASLAMVEDLAARYRYLLSVGDRHLVTVGEELDFTEGYARLLNYRFGTHLRFHFRISPHLRPRNLPPLTLQLLVENAVKHNEISRSRPLDIWLKTVDDDRIRVRNTRQPKPEPAAGAGEGLANLNQRYVLLAGEAARPLIERTEAAFSVTLTTLPHARPDH